MYDWKRASVTLNIEGSPKEVAAWWWEDIEAQLTTSLEELLIVARGAYLSHVS